MDAARNEANLAAVGEILGALARGDLSALQDHLRSDVVLHAHGNNPFAGRYSGAGEVLAYAATSSRNFDVSTTSIEDSAVEGDDVRLVIAVDLLLRTGPWPTRIVQTYHFQPDGLVDRIDVRAEDQDAFDRKATKELRIR